MQSCTNEANQWAACQDKAVTIECPFHALNACGADVSVCQ
jgi:hypothetical protein